MELINKIESGISIDYLLEHDRNTKSISVQMFNYCAEVIIYGLKEFNDIFYSPLTSIGFREDEEKILSKLLLHKFNYVGDVCANILILENILSVDEIDKLNNVFKRIGLLIPA